MASAAASACRIESTFGACSPTVMCSRVMTVRAIARAVGRSQPAAATSTPSPAAASTISVATAGSASQPRIRLARVMPSWQAER